MPEYNDLFQQILQQYGLIGLLIAFVIVGPLFTLLKTKNTQLQNEVKTQDLLNEFARQERLRADRLEKRLNIALAQLEQAQAEVFQLRTKVSQNQEELAEVPKLQAQVQSLSSRVGELETLVESERQKSQRLEAELKAKDAALTEQAQHIQKLEQQLAEESEAPMP